MEALYPRYGDSGYSMEQMVPMNRAKEFTYIQPKLITVRDSRFGLRKLYLNDKEKPSIKGYMNPGRAYHGTR